MNSISMWQMTLKILLVRAQIIKCKIPLNQQIVENRIVNREPDKKQLLDPYSQAWQTPGPETINKFRLYGSLLLSGRLW